MKKTSKFLAFLLVAAICVGFVPMFAVAATNPTISLTANAPKTSKSVIEVTLSVNSSYLTSAQLNVSYEPAKVTFTKGELITGSGADIANSENNSSTSKVLINFASVNTACSGKAFYKLYFEIKSGASGKCSFGLSAKNAYFASSANGEGVKTTSVTLNNASCDIPYVTSISAPSRPSQFYGVGEISALDMSKFSIKAKYNNNFEEKVDIKSCNCSYLKKNSSSGKYDTVSFDGKIAGNYICRISYFKEFYDFAFIVSGFKAKAVSIKTGPVKTHYISGSSAALDLSGLVLNVTESDGSVKTVAISSVNMDGLAVNGFDINTPGSQTLTISYYGAQTTIKVFVGNKLGDVDGDGYVTAADARLALRCSVKLESFDAIEKEAGDVDKNGEISSADARLILRCSVKLEVFE